MRSLAATSRVILCGRVVASGMLVVPPASADPLGADAAATGQEVWLARYISKAGSQGNEDIAKAVAVDQARNRVYVTGMSWGVSPHLTDFVTIAYDSTGTQQWLARYDGGSDDAVAGIAVDQGGGNV